MSAPASSVRRAYADGPHGQVHYRRAGDPARPALMLLHMSPQSSRSFAAVMPRLAAAGRFVVAPDYPGYGESDPVTDGERVTVEAYAESAWAVADALGLGPLDLAGHHTGSKVAVEMAHARPGDVRALLLIAVGLLTPEEQARHEGAFTPVPLDEAGTRFRRLWDLFAQHKGPGMTLAHRAEAFAEAQRGGEGYEAGHHAAFAFNAVFEARARALDHPVTVLNPKDDLWTITPRAARVFRRARVEDHPEWGHGFLSAYPGDAARAILDGLPSADGAQL